MKRHKVLVIGYKGFIGSHIYKKLNDSGYTTYGIDKVDGELSNVEHPGFMGEFIENGLDYIFHFGAPCSILQFNESPVYSVKNTLVGFQNVLNLAKATSAKLIYPSSGNVYGTLQPPHMETVTPSPNNMYGVCKFVEEKMAQASPVTSVGLRIFTGYGPGEEKKGTLKSVVCHFLQEMMADKQPVIWGDGSQIRDCIYIDNIVEACIKSMELDYSTIINIGTGTGYSYNEIVEKINKVLGKDIKPIYKSKPSNYVETAVSNTRLMYITLKLSPITLEHGLEKFYEYLKKC